MNKEQLETIGEKNTYGLGIGVKWNVFTSVFWLGYFLLRGSDFGIKKYLLNFYVKFIVLFSSSFYTLAVKDLVFDNIYNVLQLYILLTFYLNLQENGKE